MDTILAPARHLEPTKTGPPAGPPAAVTPLLRRGSLRTAAIAGGVYGMVTALAIQDATAAIELAAAGAPTFSCVIPSTT